MSYVDASATISVDGNRSKSSVSIDGVAHDIAPKTTLELVQGAEWDQLSSRFLDVNQEQTGCFSAQRWGAERIEHAVIRRDGEILGGATVLLLALPGTGRTMSMVKWGPIWRQKGKPAEASRLKDILATLKREYSERRGHYLTVFPHADPSYGAATRGILEDLGFAENWSYADPDRYLVNVNLTPEELRSSLDQKWRYNLKKSLKNDLEIIETGPEEGLDQFMTLYNQMLARKGFQDTSAISTLPALLHSEVSELRPKIFMVLHEGRPTAGAVIDTSGERAVYLYGATDERALRLKAGYAMHWWVADKLCQDPNISWYDLGGKDGDAGLHQFKKGFVGKLGVILPTPPSYEFAATWGARLTGRAIFALRDVKAGVGHALHRAKGLMSL